MMAQWDVALTFATTSIASVINMGWPLQPHMRKLHTHAQIAHDYGRCVSNINDAKITHPPTSAYTISKCKLEANMGWPLPTAHAQIAHDYGRCVSNINDAKIAHPPTSVTQLVSVIRS